jgi:hypothetical protein
MAGGRSPRSSLGLERPPLVRGLGLAWGFCFGFQVLLDFQAHGGEVVHDFGIGETNHGDVELLECNGTGSISSQTFGRVMLAAVEFDHESSRGAIKIWDERTDGSLPQKSNLVAAQELIPEFAFRRSHSRPKPSSEPCQLPSVRNSRHRKTLNNPKSPNPNKNNTTKTPLARGGRSSQWREPGRATPRKVNP